MHKHHGALRLLIILVCLVLGGLAVYLVLVYGLTRAAHTPSMSTTTPAYFPIASSTRGTSTPAASTFTPASTTVPSGEQGMKVITNADNGHIITLTKNERFVLQLGNSLKWNIAFIPPLISRVSNSTTAGGVEGIYEADALGTTTMRATGAPMCDPHQACPEFLAETTVTFVIQ